MTEKDIESEIDKIDKEISTLKTLLLEAKHAIKQEDYVDARHFLEKAEQISHCQYCQNKLKKFMADIDHVKSLCHLKDEKCSEDKDMIIYELSEFYDKQPDIAAIRRQKMLHPEEDAFNSLMEGVMAPVNAIGAAWEALLKNFSQ